MVYIDIQKLKIHHPHTISRQGFGLNFNANVAIRLLIVTFTILSFSLITTIPSASAAGQVEWGTIAGPIAQYPIDAGKVGQVPIRFEIFDDQLDNDGVIAQVNVVVISSVDPTGITLTLTETGPDSGRFVGQVVFTEDNAIFQISDTAVITIQDDCTSGTGNCDPNVVETLVGGLGNTGAYADSQSDSASHVPIHLTETGPNTGIFEGQLQFVQAPSASVSAAFPDISQLKVTGGDTITILDSLLDEGTNGFIASSGGSKGAIQVDVGGTATVKYTPVGGAEIQDVVTVSQSASPGRGGGGLLIPGLVVDTVAPSVASIASSGSSGCVGDCYPPHFGMDKFGSNIYDDGLTINGTIYDINNDFHTAPDKVLDLPVGKLVTFVVKTGDTDPDQITHGELSIGIPKGDFNKQEGTFIINIDKTFPDGFTTKVEGDRTAFRQLSTELKVDDKNAYFIYSFIPTRHLPYDMFAIYVRDAYGYDKLTFVNHGVFFRGISETGTPVYDVFDDKGRMSTITILDKTLEDLTVAVDQDGKMWRLGKDRFWEKDFEKPENYCTVTTHTFDRHCPEFKNMVVGQQLIAKQYFDSLQVQNTVKPYIASAEHGDYPRLHDSLPNMIKAQSDYTKSKLE